MCRRSAAFVFFVWLAACGSDPTLRVDLRTDLVPEIEFDEIQTTIRPIDESEERLARETALDRDYFLGARVARFDGISRGQHRVVVSLSREGSVVARQTIMLAFRGPNEAVTAVLTRDCVGVMCPAAGNPTAEACLGGICTSPECTPESPDACPAAACSTDSDCVSDALCAAGECRDGVCLFAGECGGGLWCNPDVGCMPTPTFDGGLEDAGTDAGDDAAVDAGADAADDAAMDVGTDVGRDAGAGVVPGTNLPADARDRIAGTISWSGTQFLNTDADCDYVTSQPGGTDLCVVDGDTVTIAPGSSVIVSGQRPLAIVARTNIVIQGALEMIAATSSGAGADPGGGGGGGSAFGMGGPGGSSGAQLGGEGGASLSTEMASPLVGGLAGGNGGGGALGGRGGGALALIAFDGTITFDGAIVDVSGTGGAGGAMGEGGGGGGGGGTILLEASNVLIPGSHTLVAHGGGGGGAGGSGIGLDGDDGPRGNFAGMGGTAGPSGGNGGGGNGVSGESVASGGGGGGGGGAGHIRINLPEGVGFVSLSIIAPNLSFGEF